MARAATPNFITNAKVAPATKKAAAKTEVTEVAELELYAAIDHSIKWLTTVLETVKSGIFAETVVPKFVTDGIKAEKKPDNFNASEGAATANIQIKKRASNSAFNEIELAIVEEYKVPTDTSGGLLYINPTHMEWLVKNSTKVSAALAKLDAPSDLFEQQATKIISADTSLDYVCKQFKNSPDVIAKLLPIVGTLAIKPKFDTADEQANEKALALINKYIAE